MSLLSKQLGYGLQGTIELDTFTRLLNSQIKDNEELRLEKPLDWNNGFEYIGLALAGSDPSAPVWSIIRKTWIGYKGTRLQFLDNIAWSTKDLASW